MKEQNQDTLIIYHANCSDGFGAAYAAWKKFGDTATYIPLKNQAEIDIDFSGKDVYVLDYSFTKAVDDRARSEANKVVVIDHHGTAESVVTSHPENVFDQNHSGAVLAWQYFHPASAVPELLRYIEDHDLWRFSLPDNQAYNAALRQYEHSFEIWDDLIKKLGDSNFRHDFINQGQLICKFEDSLIEDLLTYKERARFQGYEIWVLNVSRRYRSILGHRLAQLNKQAGGVPLAIVYYRYEGAVHLSLRSEDDIDVAAIAEQFGGGGHKHSASIRIKNFKDLPFEFI